MKKVSLKNKTSQSFNKFWLYFLEVLDQNPVQKEILIIRKKYDIPIKGYTSKDGEIYDKMMSLFMEDGISDEDLKKDKPSNDYYCLLEMEKEADTICQEYGLYYPFWGVYMLSYILFNIKNKPKNDPPNSSCSLGLSTSNNKLLREYFPITININPYASCRDIIDYIQVNYTSKIAPLQRAYKKDRCKIGKIKAKDPQKKKRNQFIYNNRNKTQKEIAKLVGKNFNYTMEAADIGKIISLEKKRRKELRDI